MGIWSSIGKLAIAAVIIAGAVGAGLVYSDSGTDFASDGEAEPTPDERATERNDDAVVGGGAETPTPEPDVETVDTSSTTVRDGLENFIHNAVNDYREAEGEDEVRWEPIMIDPLRRHATAMAEAQTVSRAVAGKTVSERVSAELTCDPRVVLARVNADQDSPSAIVDQWAANTQTADALTDNLNRRSATGAVQTDGRVYVVTAFC